MISARFLVLAASVSVLAGCAQTPRQSPPIAYECDGGKGFTAAYRPWGDVRVELAGMEFNLMRETADASGERYACGALTLWRSGDNARLDLQGDELYENCHPVR